MKRWKVVIAAEVQAQIEEQVLYIARDSVDHALAWEARLRRAIAGLADVAGHGLDEEASAELGHEVRKMVFEGTYLVRYYRDEVGGSVRVINFRHGARMRRQGEP